MTDRTDAALELGEPMRFFKPSIQNIVAGIIFSVAMIGGGIGFLVFLLREGNAARWTMPFQVEKGTCWLEIIGMGFISLVLVGGGGVLAYVVRQMLACGIVVYQHGFRWVTRKSVDSVLWAHITRFKETHVFERPPMLKGPAKLLLPQIKSTRYTVYRKEGADLTFDGNSIGAIKTLGKLLRAKAEELNTPWEIEEERPLI